MEVASLLLNTRLISVVRKRYLDIFEPNQLQAVRDAKSAVATNWLLKYTKNGFYVTFYHVVLRSLKMCFLFCM